MRPVWLAALSAGLACGSGDSNGDKGSEEGSTSFTSSATTGSSAATTDATATTPTSSTAAGTSPERGSTSGDPSTSGGSSESTGGELLPRPVVGLLTDQNRHYDGAMFGGWGPHLRGVMRTDQDELWFTVDAGPSVQTNARILYYRFDGASWSLAAEQDHLATIQQNAASVMNGHTVLTYGVNVAQNNLEECYLDTTDLGYKACNTITIGGTALSIPPSSNYVGAVLGPGNVRVVWYTTVGASGGAGAWAYITNAGSGWQGPFASNILGSNDFAYIHAMFVDDDTLSLVGQPYFGAYPQGNFAAGVMQFDLGTAPTLQLLESGEAGVGMLSSGDIYVDAPSGAVHVLARDDAGGVRYYVKPGGATWDQHLTPLHTFPGTFRTRFVTATGTPLYLARGDAAMGTVVLDFVDGADLSAAIDWTLAESIAFDSPYAEAGAPSAIYIEGSAYQTSAVAAINLAFCGPSPDADERIWHGAFVTP